MPTQSSSRSSFFTVIVLAISAALSAAEIRTIEPGKEPNLSGKELDWIYGDYLMTNDHLSLVVAAPLATRNANMTIRNIGASVLDLTLNDPSNDQLSAFTPAAGRYLFQDPSKVKTGRDGDAVFWQCESSRSLARDDTVATVRYQLGDEETFLKVTVRIEGPGAGKLQAIDGVRADGWFSFESTTSTAFCSDSFFRQTIGFRVPGSDKPPTWKRGRPSQLRYLDAHVERTERTVEWSVLVYPATSVVDLLSVTERSDPAAAMHTFKVSTSRPLKAEMDAVTRAEITLRRTKENGEPEAQAAAVRTDDQGVAHARLVPGRYLAVASAIGCEDVEVAFEATGRAREITLRQTDISGFEAEVTDGNGVRIPVKATIYSSDGDHPDFGLSSARTFVQNCVYSVHGHFSCPLDPGRYEVYFSRGPEYDSVRRELRIAPGEMTVVRAQLDRVVETDGWISADLHSHSSPSGDNTSDQYGRVENLLCEHVEFAPCTEHNRVSSYTPHLRQMKLTHLMATCTGIELTGAPTPVNHQNAFPLHRHPHTQNGGGPRAASNPVVQIERLAMWENGSGKLVQMNHPNLHQIHGDLDVDGVPDQGFRGMFRWTDVVEVHPLEMIFQDIVEHPPTGRRKRRIALFQWMQLLNHGYRIPGVINTDSHYNHHGSGWRRNWVASSTDDPDRIAVDEMVRQLEAGHVIMSTGPFLSVTGSSATSTATAGPGDDLSAESGRAELKVSVQCPNWMDINRVQVFINGRPSAQHHYTRRQTPDRFGGLDEVRKFDATISVPLTTDAHLIVAAIGEGMTLERVMGRRFGNRPPIAVSNPIYVDVDGNGFQANGDDLGMSLPGAEVPQ